MQRITAFLRKLKVNECFFVLPIASLPSHTVMKLGSALLLRSQEVGGSDRGKTIVDFWGDFLHRYNVEVHGLMRENIGRLSKSQRFCRFCGNTRSPLSFRRKAHAISEALGNKTLILRDECDGCNTWLSTEIEPDLVELLAIFRTLYGIKGKGGAKNYRAQNYAFEHSDASTEHTSSRISEDVPLNTFTLRLNPVRLQNAYKCLCMFFLSVLHEQLLPQFEKTIKWLNGDIKTDRLPKVAFVFQPDFLYEQPQLVTQLRTTDGGALPFAVGELLFTVLKIVFIVPFSTADYNSFTDEQEYAHFWHSFPHYSRAKDVTFYDWSSPFTKELEIDISIEHGTGLRQC